MSELTGGWGGRFSPFAGCSIKIRLGMHQNPTILMPKYQTFSGPIPSASEMK